MPRAQHCATTTSTPTRTLTSASLVHTRPRASPARPPHTIFSQLSRNHLCLALRDEVWPNGLGSRGWGWREDVIEPHEIGPTSVTGRRIRTQVVPRGAGARRRAAKPPHVARIYPRHPVSWFATRIKNLPYTTHQAWNCFRSRKQGRPTSHKIKIKKEVACSSLPPRPRALET